jgi:conjugal transfer/entry exclusion protein
MEPGTSTNKTPQETEDYKQLTQRLDKVEKLVETMQKKIQSLQDAFSRMYEDQRRKERVL